ncbi:MAG: mannose-6-phosphate isomerase, class I [Ilumatobacteraceae bacterium]
MPVRITGTIQHYAWGSTSFIPALTGHPEDGRPHAEWWLGTHPGAPSLESGTGRPLAGIVGDLPILVKVLSCESPLSLQTHPDAARARRGFDRENASGTAPSDPTRNYRDPHPKPEMLVALTPFEALCGFDDVDSSVEQLKVYGWNEEAEVLDANGIDGYLLWAFDQRGPADTDRCPAWLQEIARLWPGDRGLRVAPLLNHVSLRPGEAISLPAGNLHAYLHGSGLEVMSSSDNVIRAGFTAKHIDVTELLAVVDTRVLGQPKLTATDGVFTGPDGAFTARPVQVSGTTAVTATTVSVVVRTAGELDGIARDEAVVLQAGESMVLSGDADVWVCSAG